MNAAVIFSLITLAFIKAVLDNTAHGKLDLFKGDFWNEQVAWKYKWKNGDPKQGERFLGSSTVLVFLTSGWHLVQEILLITVFILTFGCTLMCFLYLIIFKITFEILYRCL